MNNCGTKHRVMLPTSKLNSSDSQVSRAGIFLLPLQERVTPTSFKNVMMFRKDMISILQAAGAYPTFHIYNTLVCMLRFSYA
jgi:hypothetical protein